MSADATVTAGFVPALGLRPDNNHKNKNNKKRRKRR
jgi:hypothetical protein